MDRHVETVHDPVERIAVAIRSHLEFFRSDPQLVELFIQERAEFRDQRQPIYFEHGEANCDRWRDLIRDLIAAGRVRPVPVERVMNVIGDLMYGTMFKNHLTNRQIPFDEQASDIVDIVFNGILTSGERKQGGSPRRPSRRTCGDQWQERAQRTSAVRLIYCRPRHRAGKNMAPSKFVDEPVGQLIRTAPKFSVPLPRRLAAWSRSRGPIVCGLLLGCAALAGIGIGAGCNRHAEGMGTPQRPPAPVTVATAETRDVPVYLDEIGKCAAVELVNVMPQVSGRITERHFTDGDDVKKGDLLFTIDPRPFESELAKNEATLKQNQASLALAKTEFKRVENLNQSHAASQTEYDTAQYGRRGRRAGSRHRGAGSDRKAEPRVLLHPLDRQRPHRHPDGGPGQHRQGERDPARGRAAPRPDLRRLHDHRAQPSVDQPEYGGRPAEGVRSAPGYEGAPGEGQLTFVDPAVQPGTGTVKLRATMPNPAQRFSPGQFVDVRLVLQMKKDAVLVPGQAVQVGQDGPFVYTLKGKEASGPGKPPMATADQRPIKVGQLQGDLIVIEHGVAPGDEVIVTGQMAIGPGAKVQVLPPIAPVGPGAARRDIRRARRFGGRLRQARDAPE